MREEKKAVPAAVAGPVAYRVLRKRHDGEWVTDGRAWCDGVPTQDLVDDIALRSDGWRIEYAFAAPTTQAALLEALKEAQAGLEFAAARLPHTTGFVPSHIAALNIVNAALAAAPTTQAAPVAQGDAMTYEQSYAIRQGHEIASSDAYFEARPQIDNNDRRGVFRAGFDRGWDAARTQAKEGGAA